MIVGRLDAMFRAANSGQPSDAWREFARAGNAIKVRWRDLAVADSIFQATVIKGRESPGDADEEESSIFTFFFNSLSVIELSFFHLYALAAQLDSRFSLIPGKPRAVTPGETSVQYKRYFPGDSLTTVIVAFQGDSNLKRINEVRNILSHRGTPTRHLGVTIELTIPGRQYFLGGSKGAPAEWKDLGMTLEPALTGDLRSWLSASLSSLFREAKAFAAARIP